MLSLLISLLLSGSSACCVFPERCNLRSQPPPSCLPLPLHAQTPGIQGLGHCQGRPGSQLQASIQISLLDSFKSLVIFICRASLYSVFPFLLHVGNRSMSHCPCSWSDHESWLVKKLSYLITKSLLCNVRV